MPRLTVLSQVYTPDTQSTAQLFGALFETLVQRGFEIHVICGYPAMIGDENQRRQIPAWEKLNGVSIRRVGLNSSYRGSLLRRATHYIFYLSHVSIELCRSRDCDVVVGLTNPPFTPIFLWAWSKILRFRYDVLLQDLFPDGLVALAQWDFSDWRAAIWRTLNRRAFARAEQLFVIGRDMAKLVEREYAVPANKIRFVPNWAIMERSTDLPPERTELWSRLGFQPGTFVVQYSGNMGIWHDLEVIVMAAEILRGCDEIKFLLIGGGLRREGAERVCRDLRLTNVVWESFQPRDKLRDSLSCSHASLVSFRRGLQGVAVPCKIYGILASAKPVLAVVDEASEIAELVREEHCGLVVEPDDPAALAEKIKWLWQNPDARARMSKNAARAQEQKYTLMAIADRYEHAWKPRQ